MPAYRFRWDAFNDATVHALATRIGYKGAAGDAGRAYLTAHVARPDDEFVKVTRPDLERTWLPDYPGCLEIVKRLQEQSIGPGGVEPKTQAHALQYIEKCRNSKRLRGLLVDALRRYGDEDRKDDGCLDPLAIKRYARIKPSLQSADLRKPHPHQLEAWKALDLAVEAGRNNGGLAGLLVMPTGSGKTYTAVHWLVTRMIEKGKRVLWIAHRDELLEQAASSFYALASLAPSRETLRIRLVSGAHCHSSMIDPADDIVIASVASLGRNPRQALLLTEDPDRMVVIDEAHHAVARTYVDLLESIKKKACHHLIGLTATPTRTQETERPVLAGLFNGKTIFSVAIQDLIERGILAQPVPVRVETHVDVDRGMTAKELAQYDHTGELSEAHLDRIAQSNKRNKVIVDHYLEQKEKYGKTLVFAINVAHAAILAGDFRKMGVKADYVASYRPDDAARTDAEILKDFLDGDLEVLVNVNILTEGVDLPNTQSVFLVRPTNSEILVRQMIGRALRGKGAGGTDKAYLVSFLDSWEVLRDWKDPLSLVPDVALPPISETQPTIPTAMDLLPWDLIRTIADQIWMKGWEHLADAFESVPAGYYHTEWETGEATIDRVVPVYAHQKPCFDELIKQVQKLDPSLLPGLTLDVIRDQFFVDCDDPQPSNVDLSAVLEMLKSNSVLTFSPTENRNRVDPYVLAKEISDRDLGEKAKRALMDERFSFPLAQAIYRTERAYHGAIEDALFEIAHPGHTTRSMKIVPTFEPPPENALKPGPYHDLDRLFGEMLSKGAELLGLNELPGSPRLEWTKRIAKSVFAKAYFEERTGKGEGRIRMNILLDSPDVSEETMRYLLWHEYLHLYLKVLHPPEFRKHERMWPSWVDGDRELDTLHERFGITYW